MDCLWLRPLEVDGNIVNPVSNFEMQLEDIVYYTVLNEIALVWEVLGSKTLVFPRGLTHFGMHLWGEGGGLHHFWGDRLSVPIFDKL